MLHFETVSPGTLRLLRQLTNLPELSEFLLVGGTSLSLQIGHRISVDLDFFTDKYFDANLTRIILSQEFPRFELVSTSRIGFSSFIDGVKCDFYNWSVPFIGEKNTEEQLRLCSLQDIVAFKLDAIISRKEKKDFCDIEALLHFFSFEEMLILYRTKYPLNDVKIVLQALAEIDLVDASEEPVFIVLKDWGLIKNQLNKQWQLFQDGRIKKKEIETDERMKRIEALLKTKKNTGN
jgi:Nucleotidyl transferase AbiEii toxin, Type IV TA system